MDITGYHYLEKGSGELKSRDTSQCLFKGGSPPPSCVCANASCHPQPTPAVISPTCQARLHHPTTQSCWLTLGDLVWDQHCPGKLNLATKPSCDYYNLSTKPRPAILTQADFWKTCFSQLPKKKHSRQLFKKRAWAFVEKTKPWPLTSPTLDGISSSFPWRSLPSRLVWDPAWRRLNGRFQSRPPTRLDLTPKRSVGCTSYQSIQSWRR